jgi:ribonuclease E
MTKRMLIDATHAEETRVVVLDGHRLEDFDVETSTKRQLKGNIYLAKVVRVEPSLQAAFVEYGGNRHGFLAFSEIHPDYYQIPVADRQRLLDMQAEEARREEEEEDEDLERALTAAAADFEAPGEPADQPQAPPPTAETWAFPSLPLLIAAEAITAQVPTAPIPAEPESDPARHAAEAWAFASTPHLLRQPDATPKPPPSAAEDDSDEDDDIDTDSDGDSDGPEGDGPDGDGPDGDGIEILPPPETVGGGDHDTGDESRERRMPSRFMRNYKIQEVIRRRQIMLVQVVKEERGTKGAALTSYLSLAGRFGVLMPNSPRGGGISRKITSATDRRRLKEVMAELDIPRGMGLIVRTAGANRPKPEIKRDCEYLLRLWDDIREQTMKSVAPALIYEEASLIKRAIRDVYSRDIDEIVVDGEEGWRAAHDFMRMLMPAHAKKVQLWRDGGQPLFPRYQVEAQLDGMLQPTVQLRSGGYLVINQAEALVAIDVNSGRSTRERNIEETALRTNLEAADEVARQLRLRDLAGLIVIDFIDMESKRHNAMVERRIKEALKNDRARIQVGHISHFGLLEMSRQRLRPSLAETSFIPCPHCGGTGHVRSTENAAIYVLRGIEDEGGKRRSAEIIVHVNSAIALYLLNHKRERLREIESRYAMRVIIAADDDQIAPAFRIDRIRQRSLEEAPPIVTPDRMLAPMPSVEDEPDEEEDVESTAAEEEDEDQDDEAEETSGESAAAGSSGDADRRPRRRRRRRRGNRRDEAQGEQDAAANGSAETGAEQAPSEQFPVGQTQTGQTQSEQADGAAVFTPEPANDVAPAESTSPAEGTAPGTDAPSTDAPSEEEDPRNRRRGRRGGRRRRRDEGELSPYAEPGAEQPELLPAYAGPTPADPFGGRAFDIFDVMDQVERAHEAASIPTTQAGRTEGEIVNRGAPEPDSVAHEPVTHHDPAQDTPDSDTKPSAAVPDVSGQAEIVNTGAPEVAVRSDTTEATVEEAAVEPEPAPAEPAVKPILIGAGDEPPAERKRGWWRR